MRIEEDITKVAKQTVAFRCDECGKEIRSEQRPEGWHSFRYGTWGLTRDDSWWEGVDVCSVDCYFKCLEEALENSIEEVDNMSVPFAKSLLEFHRKVNPIEENK